MLISCNACDQVAPEAEFNAPGYCKECLAEVSQAIEKQQGIQMTNPPTSKPWQEASNKIHKLATVLNGGIAPKDARG